ncbi:MAG: hypothetical protein ACMUEL_06855 [Flavobacteriales bacterium Tduv]
MRFSHVFLAAFLIMSCNDEKKEKAPVKVDLAKNEKKQKVENCSTNIKKECITGSWKIKSAKLGGKDKVLANLNLNTPQKAQYLDLKSDKISGKIFLVKRDAIELGTSVSEIPETTYRFEEGTKKIIFNAPNKNTLNFVVKEFKEKEMTLEFSGKTTGPQAKDYILQTVWSKK